MLYFCVRMLMLEMISIGDAEASPGYLCGVEEVEERGKYDEEEECL